MKIKKLSLTDTSVLTIVTIVLFGVVIYAGNVMTVNTSKITDIICLVSFAFMPISGIIYTMCFLIPLHSGITGLYIYGYAVLMILFKTKKFQAKVIFPVAIITVYEIIMMMFVESGQFKYIIIYALIVFLLFHIMNTEEVDPKAACISYICGTLVLVACIFTTAVQNSSWATVLSGEIRIGEYEGIENIGQVAVVTENANAMAYYALVAIAIAFSLVKNVKLLGKILLAVAMLILAVIGLFTVSRTFVIVLAILFLLAIFSRGSYKQKVKILAVICIVLAIVIPYILLETQIFDAFIERFEDGSFLTGTGRTNIFSEYMKFLWDNPMRLIFGTGAVFYRDVCQMDHSMHNGTQQILVSYGILGFIPMVWVLISPIVDFLKKNKFNMIKFLPIVAVFLFTQTIQFLNPNNLMLPYAVAILCMKIPDMEVQK